MPVGFSSPARNLFLLASTAGGTLANFFKTLDQSSGTDVNFEPTEIRNIATDETYTLAGEADNSSGDRFGWFENVDYTGSENWSNKIQSSTAGTDTTLRTLEIDGAGNYLVAGKTGTHPWIAKYSSTGVLSWDSTTFSGGVEYTGIAVDSNNVYYTCGSTPSFGNNTGLAFVEKFSNSGTPDWGKSSILLNGDVSLSKIAANSRGEVVAVGWLDEGTENAKGYIVKIDTTTGDVKWDRSIKSYAYDNGEHVYCEDVTIDDEDNIYIVGRLVRVSGSTPRGFVARYSPEGNLIWQKETPFGEDFEYYQVKIDNTTKQLVTYGRYIDSLNQQYGILTKYESIGDQIWRRKMYVSNTTVFGQTGRGGAVNLDASTQWYYMLYIDMNNADKYTFGRVSSSGNGLGAFQYAEGTGETVYYEILNIDDRVGRLQDGSVRNDVSDLVSYPFNANKLMFDDLATPIANKKVQVAEPNEFDYSGSPAIRTSDFKDINLLGDTGFVEGTSGTVSYSTETWSSYVSNGSTGGTGPAKAFDGDIANFSGYSETNWTRSATTGNTPAVFDVSSVASMADVTEVKVYVYVLDSGNDNTLLAVNDSNVTTGGSSGFQVYTIDVSGTGLETIKYKYKNSNGPYCYLTGVSVSINGNTHQQLIDGVPPSAVDIGTIQFGFDNSDNTFDTSDRSIVYNATGLTYNTWGTAQLMSGLGGNGANSVQVWKTSNLSSVLWRVSTNSSDRYIFTSDDGINWVGTGVLYDTDTTAATVTSKWLATGAGANVSTITVTGSTGGTNYSNRWAANVNYNHGGPNSFDGSTSTRTEASDNVTATWTAGGSGIPVSSTLRLYTTGAGNIQDSDFTINGIELGRYVVTSTGWKDISIGPKYSDMLTSSGLKTAQAGFNPPHVNSGTNPIRSEGTGGLLFTPTTPIPYSSQVEVLDNNNVTACWFNQTNSSGSSTQHSNGWVTVASGSGTINTMYFERTDQASYDAGFCAIRVDGTILENGVNGAINTIAVVHRSGQASTELFAVEVDGSILTDGDDVPTGAGPSTPGSWADQSGKGNNAVTNGPTHNAGGWWEFDGTNDTIDLGTTSLIAPSSSFSIEAWCWVDSLTQECSIYEISAIGNSGTILLSAGSTTDGNVGGRFLVRNSSGGNQQVRDVVNNNTGEWHHYIGVHINNGIYSSTTLYVDGVGTLSEELIDTTHPFDFTNVGVQHLGLSSGTRYLDGRIAEFRIYPRALTAGQVFQNYNASKQTYTGVAPSTDPGLTSTRTP